jgi:hypothetical protein
MKIAIYQTEHEINKRVTQSLYKGLLVGGHNVSIYMANSGLADADVHIAYGILRGTAEIFKAAEKKLLPWFNVDRGYWGAGHYGGKYRISCRGTQAKWDSSSSAEFGQDHSLELLPYKPRDGYTLICPPSDYVCEWLGIDKAKWVHNALQESSASLVRDKSETDPINWEHVAKIITFNSSVAIEAVRRGIPVVSDKDHSAIGSFQDVVGEIHLDTTYREMLLRWLSAHQMSLNEIERGDIWKVINHYIKSSSAMTPGNPSLAQYASTQLRSEPNLNYK